jgi:hypothetical protein
LQVVLVVGHLVLMEQLEDQESLVKEMPVEQKAQRGVLKILVVVVELVLLD